MHIEQAGTFNIYSMKYADIRIVKLKINKPKTNWL